MKIDFDFDKCIYCLKNNADSWEHIIPESIGGRLQAKILCSDCNNDKLGSELISKVKTDPSIRLAIRELECAIPELFEQIENHQTYVAKDINNDLIKLKYKNLRFEIIAHKKGDYSLVLDPKKGIKNLRQILKKDGLSKDEIEDKINTLKKSDENEIIQLSKNKVVGNFSTGPIYPSLEGPLLDEKFIALIAYEFLSLLLGNLIYDKRFDFIREFIKEGRKSDKLNIESLSSEKYGAFHTIYPKLLETEVIINIILFRWLVYEVQIKGFNLSCSDYVYVEDLKNKKTLIAESVNEYRQSIFLNFDSLREHQSTRTT